MHEYKLELSTTKRSGMD